MDRDRINDYTRQIKDHCRQNQYNIALIVKRSRRIDDIYKAIKQLVCCDLGMPAQVRKLGLEFVKLKREIERRGRIFTN